MVIVALDVHTLPLRLPSHDSRFRFPRVLAVEWKRQSPQAGANARRRVVVDHKIPRDPVSGVPLGMVTTSTACSARCSGPDAW